MDASCGAEYIPPAQGPVRPSRDAPSGPVLIAAKTTERMARKCLAQAAWPAVRLGIVLLYGSGPALAEQSPAERRGLRFVSLNCAQCHAIDKVSASRLANAPPFRTLGLIKYGVADLQRPLAEGIHPTMPLFRLTSGGIEDVMAYLKTLR